jgi:hypothetical protein
MAIAGFKVRYFDNAHALQVFVSTQAVTAVSAIVFDNQSNKFVLFYT